MPENEYGPIEWTADGFLPRGLEIGGCGVGGEEVVLRTIGVVFDGGLCCSEPAERWSVYAAGALADELGGGDSASGLATLPDFQWEGAGGDQVVAVAEALHLLLNAVQEHGQPALMGLTQEQTASLRDAAAVIKGVGRTVWTRLATNA